MKQVGIIGGLEFIGCLVTLKFLEEDYLVKVLTPERPGRKLVLPLKSLASHKNLTIFKPESQNPSQLRRFLQDCDILIHCGTPYRLEMDFSGPPLYVPLIKSTGTLFKIIREFPELKKVIFIASAAVLYVADDSPVQIPERTFSRITSGKKENTTEKARDHADKTIRQAIRALSEDLFEVIIVAPVEVSNNAMCHNKASTEAGIRYLLRKRIQTDPYFHQISRKKALTFMISTDDLSGVVFAITQTLH